MKQKEAYKRNGIAQKRSCGKKKVDWHKKIYSIVAFRIDNL